MTEALQLSPFPEVIEAFRRGEMVILVDDEDRENEGDLAIATECVSPETVRFMMREARGLICVSITAAVARRLNLPQQAESNNSPFGTPFTVSVDLRQVAGEGVSASARARTMRALIDPATVADDLVTPGHVFPLVANPAGVIGRQGQTEGTHDLARIAGFQPSGVLCEILNADGTMARGRELNAFAQAHGLLIASIDQIARYRISEEILVREVARSRMNTDYGEFDAVVFEDDVDGKEHIALVKGSASDFSDKPPVVRIHSECLTGDIFGSERCDCGGQLAESMRRIAQDGGVLLYLRQEGRGIGLGNKLRAYALQDQGHDTVEANVKLGFPVDSRDYAVAAKILASLEAPRIRLLTNNPQKIERLSQCGIQVVERLPVIMPANPHSRAYLETKKSKLGHLI